MATWLDQLIAWVLNNLNSIGLLLIGTLLALFSSWFVARYTWKAQRDDERRMRVYAPLHDELSNIKTHLDGNEDIETKEYNQINSQHLLYLAHKNIEIKLHELYDVKLPTITASKITLNPRVADRVRSQMNQSFGKFTPTSQTHQC